MNVTYGASTEQRCVRSGLWRIEGFTVERKHSDKWWYVYDSEGYLRAIRRTLVECRQWIREEIFN